MRLALTQDASMSRTRSSSNSNFSRQVPSSIGAIQPIDEGTCLLKFEFEEERVRDIDASCVNAIRLAARARRRVVARVACDLIGPERQPARIRLAAEKVQIVLPHKEAGLVHWIAAAVYSLVVVDRQGSTGG